MYASSDPPMLRRPRAAAMNAAPAIGLRRRLGVCVSALLLSLAVVYALSEPRRESGWLIGALVLAVSGFACASGYRRRHASPTLPELVDTLRAAQRDGNYGVRVPVRSDDELARLAGAVNTLLEAIEADRLALQARARQLEARIDEHSAALQQAQASLLAQERLATLGKLTGTVSHELRNPLGTIQTSIDVLREDLGACEPKIERTLRRIERNIHRCESIINELLDYSRGSPPNLQRVPVDAWLHDILAGYPHPLRIECGRIDAVAAEFDPERLRRAVINVLDNAWQACTERPSATADAACVRVAVQAEDARLEIHIADNGVGMSEEVRGRVFEPLFSTRAFGVGLGLAIVRQILQQHGGGVELESVPNQGTQVCLWLPWRRGHGSEAA